MSASEATRLAQECLDQALLSERSTREVARELIEGAKPSLVRFLAVEFIVAEVQRAQRTATLEAEREARQQREAMFTESPGAAAARAEERLREEWLIDQSLTANIQRAVDRYVEEVKMRWTDELLDSTFALRDGTPVKWGDATIEQHEERQQMFKDNARANIEGAARHESALRDLRESGASTLRELVRVAA